MRVSTDSNDPGYSVWVHVLPVTTTLDGEVVNFVITADDEAGEVVTLDKNNRDADDNYTRVTKKGKVVITIQCPEHKTYRAIRRPRCDCQECWAMWEFLSSK